MENIYTAEMLGLHSKCKGHKLVNATSDALSFSCGHEYTAACREKMATSFAAGCLLFATYPWIKFNSSITAALYFFTPCLLVEPYAVAVAAGTSAACGQQSGTAWYPAPGPDWAASSLSHKHKPRSQNKISTRTNNSKLCFRTRCLRALLPLT